MVAPGRSRRQRPGRPRPGARLHHAPRARPGPRLRQIAAI